MNLEIFLLFLLIMLSFVFSGTETAFFSLSEVDLHNYSQKYSSIGRILGNLRKKKSAFLVTLLFMNTFVNVFFISIFNSIFYNMRGTGTWAYLGNILAITLILLIAGEITPKIIAVYRTEFFIKSIGFTYIFHFLALPFSRALSWLIDKITGTRKESIDYSELKEILAYLKDHEKNLKDEVMLVEKYLAIRDLKARDLSVRVRDVYYIERDASAKTAMDAFRKGRFSRMPVINRTKDNVTGILYFKDMIFVDENSSIKGIVRDAHFISEHTEIFRLLNYFLREKIHIAVLQNNEGKTSGIITLNNIIERILGPLPDDTGDEE